MIIKEKISQEKFGELLKDAKIVKMVVDIEREVLVLGCYFHVDCAEELLNDGSRVKDLWGANFYPQNGRVDFSAVFNIRPQHDNRSMGIQDPAIKKRVDEIVRKLLPI